MELLESAKEAPKQAPQEVKEHRKVYGIAGIDNGKPHQTKWAH